MSDTDAAGGDAHDDHGDHADGLETLGPIDIRAWGAFAIGIGLGLLVAVCVALSTGAI